MGSTPPHRNNPDEWQPYIWRCSGKGFIERLCLGSVPMYHCYKSFQALGRAECFYTAATFAEAQAVFEGNTR